MLRTGVPRDGRELWGMPSEIFQHLSDADMKALIADLRTLKPGGKPTQPPKPWEADAKELMRQGRDQDRDSIRSPMTRPSTRSILARNMRWVATSPR